MSQVILCVVSENGVPLLLRMWRPPGIPDGGGEDAFLD